MPSFKTLSLIATLAFAALADASPMSTPTTELVVRDTCKPLPQVFQESHTTLTPLLQKLTTTIKLDIGVEVDVQIQPIIEDIKVVLNAAIADVAACSGLSRKNYLTYGDKHYAVIDVAHLLANLFTLIFTAIGTVIRVVGVARLNIVLPLLIDVASLVAELLTIVIDLVDGILIALIPLIIGVLNIIIFLDVDVLLRLLGLGVSLSIELGRDISP